MTDVSLVAAEYRDKVKACWLGKNVGGTLGAPFEGVPWPLDLTFYDPTPERPIPNDDLELQLLWLCLMEQHGVKLSHKHLADGWRHNIKYGMDEYGVAKWNLARNIEPPLSGYHNNWFVHGMGAAIRSEIWACLFPGQPELAAHFARLDSSVDHAGDGVWGEMFLAAAESAAFAAETPEQALDVGLKTIPLDCGIARVVAFVKELHHSQVPADRWREKIMREFGSHNFTDVIMNVGFLVSGLLRGQGDFSKAILQAVNCGMDTDCSGATCGAFMGILLGTAGIPKEWLASLSDQIAVGGLTGNLNLPANIDELTERTVTLRGQLQEQLTDSFRVDLSPTPLSALDDGYEWLLFTETDEFMVEPPQVTAATKAPEKFADHVAHFSQIHMDLKPYCTPPKETIYLLTHLRVPCDVQARLMLSADTGITAWLDGQEILSYYGRLRALPSCHRVEGGASIPVSLRANQSYLLKVRLLFCHAPLMFSAALCDNNNQYVPGFEFKALP